MGQELTCAVRAPSATPPNEFATNGPTGPFAVIADERSLMQAFIPQRRRFIKPLRQDAGHTAVFPNALRLHVGAVPGPLAAVSAFIALKERAARDIASSGTGECDLDLVARPRQANVAGGALASIVSAPQATSVHRADGGHCEADDRVQPAQRWPERFRRKVVQQIAGDNEHAGKYAQADARSALNQTAVA